MTEREYEQLRRQYQNPYERSEEPEDGYFAFFKLRVLICFVLFLAIVAANTQFQINDNEKVQAVLQLLNSEKVSVEECFSIINDLKEDWLTFPEPKFANSLSIEVLNSRISERILSGISL